MLPGHATLSRCKQTKGDEEREKKDTPAGGCELEKEGVCVHVYKKQMSVKLPTPVCY